MSNEQPDLSDESNAVAYLHKPYEANGSVVFPVNDINEKTAIFNTAKALQTLRCSAYVSKAQARGIDPHTQSPRFEVTAQTDNAQKLIVDVMAISGAMKLAR